MATTKSVNEQYAAVAKYATEVFNTMLMPADGVDKLTARQVCQALNKRLHFQPEVNQYAHHEVQAPGMCLGVTPFTVFDTLAKLETALKVKPADRVRFMHVFTHKPEDLLAVCTLPAQTKQLAACCAKDNALRGVMVGVYLDFAEGQAVASDGHILQWLPLTDAKVCDGVVLDGVSIPSDFAARHAGKVVSVCAYEEIREARFVYCEGERASIIEGRYPRWRSVIPEYTKAQTLQVGDAWAQLREAVNSCASMDKDGKVKAVCTKGESVIHLSSLDGGFTQDVEMKSKAKSDFRIGLTGEYLTRIADANTWAMGTPDRAMIFADGVCTTLLMPVLLPDEKPETVDEEPDGMVCDEPEETEAVSDTPAPVEEEVQPEPTPAPTGDIVSGMRVRVKGTDTVGIVEKVIGERVLLKMGKQRAITTKDELETATAQPKADAPVSEPEPTPEVVEVVTPTEPVCEQPEETEPEPVSEASTDDATVFIADYSEKAFIIWGATKPYRAALKKYGAWNGKREGWIFSKKRREYVEQLIGANLQQADAAPTAAPATSAPASETPASVKEETDRSPLLKQYADFKQKYPDAVLLFRCGDFYEMYEDDAQVAADLLGITLTRQGSMRMAGFPHHALDTYLPKLIRAGHRCAICDKLEKRNEQAASLNTQH